MEMENWREKHEANNNQASSLDENPSLSVLSSRKVLEDIHPCDIALM